MSYSDSVGKLYGLQKIMKKHGVPDDIVYGTCKSNRFFIKFLKSIGVPYVKWNPRYKGSNTAELVNAGTISDSYYNEFVSYLKEKSYE